MSNDEQPVDYWSLIDDAFDKVDIYNGANAFLGELRRYPPAIQHLLAAHWCDSEVCNGGLDQLFLNSTGVLAPEGVRGFIAIGMPRTAAVLQRAIRRFGPRYPRDRVLREYRWAQLPKTDKRALGGLGRAFSRLDTSFYAAMDKEGGFVLCANKYASRVQDGQRSLASSKRAKAKKK